MNKQLDKAVVSRSKQFLKKSLLSTMKVEEQELNKLLDLFDYVTFKKNDLIVKQGQVQEYFYFICKGVIRIYFYKNGKPVIERFVKEGGFFGSNFSHITKEPGIHNYEALEDMEMLRIRYTDLNKLCKESHQVERLYRLSLELLHVNYVNRFYTFANLNSEERYHQFITDYGDIMNRIPLKYVANYLGMTSETLSRIRAKYDRPSPS